MCIYKNNISSLVLIHEIYNIETFDLLKLLKKIRPYK